MRRDVWWVAAALVLSGCLGGGTEDLSTQATVPVGGDGGTGLGNNTTIPYLFPAIDPWADEVEKILFDGNVQPNTCFTQQEQLTATALRAATGNVWYGCYAQLLADGQVVVEGTKRLKIEADAGQSLKTGQYIAWLFTYGGNEEAAPPFYFYESKPSSTPTATFEFDLKAHDWDPQGRTKSGLMFGFFPGGTNGVLEGPIKAKLTIAKDPKFEPKPVLDEWKMKDKHKFAGPNAIVVMDSTLEWKQPSEVSQASGALLPAGPKLTDVIPAGTRQVVLVMKWEEPSGCPALHDCRMFVTLRSGGHLLDVYGGPRYEYSRLHRVVTYDVPDHAGEDGPYVTQSSTKVVPTMLACFFANDQDCDDAPTTEISAKARFVMEAWNTDADLREVRQRYGIA